MKRPDKKSTPNAHAQTFYLEKHTLTDFPDAMIYKGTHSPNYYVRLNTISGYVTKSLKTRVLQTAIVRASARIPDLILKTNLGLPTTRQTIGSMFHWYLNSYYAEDLSHNRRQQIIRTGKLMTKFFGDKTVELIRHKDWHGWWRFRIDAYNDTPWNNRYYTGYDKPALSTLRHDLTTYHQVGFKALEHGLIGNFIKAPPVPKRRMGYNKREGTPRATYTEAQYRKFREALNQYVDDHSDGGKHRFNRAHQYYARSLRACLWTIRHTGARVLEICKAKHGMLEMKKIKTTDGETHQTFSLFITATKYKNHYSRIAIFTHTGTQHMLRWLDYKKSMGFTDNDDDYIFALWRNRKKHINPGQLTSMFKRIAIKAGVYQIGGQINPTNATPRILRRLFIVRALDNGVPVEKIAHQVGHTVETCQRFYNSVQAERYETEIYSGSWHPNQMLE